MHTYHSHILYTHTHVPKAACASLWMPILLGIKNIHVTTVIHVVAEEGQKESRTKLVRTEPKRMAAVIWLFALVKLYKQQIFSQLNLIIYLQKLLLLVLVF